MGVPFLHEFNAHDLHSTVHGTPAGYVLLMESGSDLFCFRQRFGLDPYKCVAVLLNAKFNSELLSMVIVRNRLLIGLGQESLIGCFIVFVCFHGDFEVGRRPFDRQPFDLPGGLLCNPAERLGGDMRQKQQIVTPEGIGGFPLFAVAVAALERGVEAWSRSGVVLPDGGTDSVGADFMRGFIIGSVCIFHIWSFNPPRSSRRFVFRLCLKTKCPR